MSLQPSITQGTLYDEKALMQKENKYGYEQ